MDRAQLQERLALLRSKGGISAAAFWLIRTTGRIDLFKVLTLEYPPAQPGTQGHSFELVELRSASDIDTCGHAILATLDRHCGQGVAAVVSRGGRVFAAVGPAGVLCQLTIDTRFSLIDTPCDLVVELPEGDCFLSFLYTPPESRQGGWAKALIAAVSQSLALEGIKRCLCHVQATNVRSLRTFSSAGWQVRGVLAATPGRRFLGYWEPRKSELRFRARPPAI